MEWMMAEQRFPYAVRIDILRWAAVLLSDNPVGVLPRAVDMLINKKYPIFPASLLVSSAG